jgi:integrase
MKLVTRWAASFEVNLLSSDPLNELRKIAVSRIKKQKRTFTLDEARAILKAAEDTEWHLPFIIYFSTGIRKMALILRVGADFDHETKLLTVRVGEGNKVSHEDSLPLGEAATQALIRRDIAAGDPLFPSPKGGFYAEKEPYRALQSACKKAGVPRGGCHAMRRCAATEIARMKGTDISSLILGHLDGKRTLAEAQYIQATADDARDAVQSMEEALLA